MTGPSVALAYVLMAVLSLLGFVVAGLMLGYIAQIVVRHLRTRRELAEAPEVSLADARDALDYVLADPGEVHRRLLPIARELRDLRNLPGRYERLYVNGADR